MPKRRRDERGFTLIELLVVMVIIAVLLGVAIPHYLGVQRRSQDLRAKVLVRHAAGAMASYKLANGVYPDPNQFVAEEPAIPYNPAPTANAVTFNFSFADSYALQVSPSWEVHAWFRIAVDSAGIATRTCGRHGQGGCGSDGTW